MHQLAGRAALRESLEAERECCVLLGQALEEERASAAAHDLERLLASLKAREAATARWHAAARQRERHLAGLGAPLAAAVKDDPGLAGLAGALARDVAALRRAQRINEAIVRASLRSVNDLLATLRCELPGSRYDDRATLSAPLPGASRASWQA